MILYLLAIVAFLTFIFHRLLSPLNYWSKQGIKQRNPWGAFLFNWFIFLKRQNVVHFVENLYTEFPSERYSGCYQFNKPALVLRDPDLIRDVTIKKFDYFTDRRTYVPEEADPLWGKNLFALKGAQWRNMRSTLSPAFTGSKLKGVFVLMQSCARNFVDHFSEKQEELIDVEVKDVFTRFCNDVIATTAFGVEVDSLKRPENEFYVMGRKATNFSTYKMAVKFMGFLIAPRLYKLLRIKFFDDDVSAFFRTLIDDAILLREQKKVYRPDVIQLLLEARNGQSNSETSDNQSTTSRVPTITNEEITAQALVFFFAGFESLSTLMTFAAYELAINPEVQDELRREIQKTSEKCSGDLTYDALVNMKYLDMVISETLRKWPSQVAAERICTEPCVLEEAPGLKLAVGDVVIFPTYGLHHDPVYFPRPELFDPERFSEANRAGIRPYSFQPFGLGPRNCIGSRFAVLEAKILFFYLLGSFEIVPVEKTVVPVVLDKRSMVLAAEGGMWLGLKRLGSS